MLNGVHPPLSEVSCAGGSGASGAVEECTRPQHARVDVQGLGALESHLPVLRTTDNATGAYSETGQLLFLILLKEMYNNWLSDMELYIMNMSQFS